MKNTKMVGGLSVLGAVLATAALSGCTGSSNGTTASGGTATASASTTPGGTSSTSTAAASSATDTAQATSTATSGGSGSGSTTCTDADLKVTESGAGAASLHTGWILVFTNTGSASCTIEGYPGAGVTDTPGQVVLNATRRQVGFLGGEYPAPAAISLAPGQAASTVLEWVDAPQNGQEPVGANCPGMDSGKVLITPPNTKQSTAFPAPADLCSSFEIHPVVTGTSGRG